MKRFLQIGLLTGSLLIALSAGAEAVNEEDWNNVLKDKFFPGRAIVENSEIIDLETPYPALMLVKVVS